MRQTVTMREVEKIPESSPRTPQEVSTTKFTSEAATHARQENLPTN